MANRLLIILATGVEDRGNRATLAFAMGVASIASGVETTMFMTVGGAYWSRESACKKIQIDGFEPLAAYVDSYREGGGKILVCSPCNDFYCSMAKDSPLMPGATIAGLTQIVDIALDASVVTF